jgi:hypothetical protein
MDEKFTQFANYLDLKINAENYDTYQQLYHSFEKFGETIHGSTEYKFICWSRQYNPIKINSATVNETQTQQLSLTTPINTPQNSPNHLEYSPNHLPDALTKLQRCQTDSACFNNFTLIPSPIVEQSDILTELMQNNEFIEILHDSNEDEALQITQPPPTQTRGKNIDLLKATYAEEQTKKASKRSRSKPGSVRGSGRLTKDAAMLRIANFDDEEDAKTTTSMALKELRLLTSTGDIRKKMPIYTRYPKDISCYAIKHYSSFEFIADQRKLSLDTIKKHRDNLQHLNYLETNMIPYIEENTIT